MMKLKTGLSPTNGQQKNGLFTRVCFLDCVHDIILYVCFRHRWTLPRRRPEQFCGGGPTVGPAVAATPLEAAASEEELPRALKRAAPQLLERRLRDQREQVRERRVVYLTEP